ncbi:MAG: hypothetical protein P4L43_05555 [Syntrophobacteraceae bacterium]|nr:hypothetical protein [Syntrophobacteraceae bacterium]
MNGSEAEKIEERYLPSVETAKIIIKEYFEQHHGEIIDYVDLVNALDLPLPLIVQACEQLDQEGKIAGVD